MQNGDEAMPKNSTAAPPPQQLSPSSPIYAHHWSCTLQLVDQFLIEME